MHCACVRVQGRIKELAVCHDNTMDYINNPSTVSSSGQSGAKLRFITFEYLPVAMVDIHRYGAITLATADCHTSW